MSILYADVLNSDASLNSYEAIGSMAFIPGSDSRLIIKMKQPQRKDLLRYIPLTTSILTFSLPKKDGTVLLVGGTMLDAGDRSLWYADLSGTQTQDLVGGSFTFNLDELGTGLHITKGYVQNGLQLIITGAC